MNYSVVIPSLYEVDKDYLKLCVESLRESGFGGQIIVVTNGSKYNPPLSEIKGISVHLHTNQQGQCNAVNIGAQVATADYLLISNSDMYYAPEWNQLVPNDLFGSKWVWDEGVRRIDTSNEHLVFSPNLIEPTNNAGSAPPFLKLDGGLNIESFKKSEIDRFVKEQIKPAKEQPGFNLPFFIKRDFWNFLGGYDVTYDPWGSNSDTDLQTRINLAGITPMRWPSVLVYHFSNKTPTFAPENDAFRMHNFEYFKEKFGFDRDELGSDVWYNKDMIPEDKERIKYVQKPYAGL